MEVVSCFQYLGSCFIKNEVPHEIVDLRVREGQKPVDVLVMTLQDRTVSFSVMRVLYEIVLVPSVATERQRGV